MYFPTLKESVDFLFHLFDSGVLYGGLGKLGTQLNLNTTIVGDIAIALPPTEEQIKIAEIIDVERERVGRIEAMLERSVSAMEVYRSALISATVTGQIDVRKYRPREAAAACL